MAFSLTPLTRAGRQAREKGTDPEALPDLIRAGGEMAALRLSLGLSEALMQAADRLESPNFSPPGLSELELATEAAALARTWRHEIVQDFRRHFGARHARACLHRPSLLSGYRIDFDIRQLRIVQHDRLDDSLEPGLLAEAIRHMAWHCLPGLVESYARLLGVSTFSTSEMPLAPKLVEAALADALRGQAGRHEAKDRLMKALCELYPRRVADSLQDVREFLDGQAGTPPIQADADIEAAPESTLPGDQATYPACPDHAPVVATEIHAAAQPVAMEAPTPTPAPGGMETLRLQLFERLARLQDRAMRAGERLAAQSRPVTGDSGGEATLGPPPMEAPRGASTTLRSLKTGTWLEIREPGQAECVLKLAWISPLRNLFLLTSHQGVRARSLDADTLESLIRAGWARVAADPAGTGQPIPQPTNQHRQSA